VKALPGNPYDGHTLATVIPDMEAMVGNTLERNPRRSPCDASTRPSLSATFFTDDDLLAHTVDTLLVMAADTVAGFIKGLLAGKRFRQTSYALDRASREATLARLFEQSIAPADGEADELIAA
jgi:hypothetical protein